MRELSKSSQLPRNLWVQLRVRAPSLTSRTRAARSSTTTNDALSDANMTATNLINTSIGTTWHQTWFGSVINFQNPNKAKKP